MHSRGYPIRLFPCGLTPIRTQRDRPDPASGVACVSSMEAAVDRAAQIAATSGATRFARSGRRNLARPHPAWRRYRSVASAACARAVDLRYFGDRSITGMSARSCIPADRWLVRRSACALCAPSPHIGDGHRTGSSGVIQRTRARSIAARGGLRCRVALPRRPRRAPHRSRSFPVRSRAPVVWWPLPGLSPGRSGERLRGCVG
jgi:hypothetical protein